MNDVSLGYIAVPKAASSSIRNLIREREAARLFPDRNFTHHELKATIDKRIRRSATPHQVLQIRESLHLFSVVRHPLTRMYSCYRDKVVKAAAVQRRCSLSLYGIEFGMSFDEFAERIANIPDERADQHFRSQHTFLMNEGALLTHSLGRLESIDEFWRALAERYGLTALRRERRVSGPPVDVRDLPLSKRGISLATERYRRDFELFDYAGTLANIE